MTTPEVLDAETLLRLNFLLKLHVQKCINRSHCRSHAVADFKSQLCRNATMLCGEAYCEYEGALGDMGCLGEGLAHWISRFPPSFQGFRVSLPFSTDTQQPEFIVITDNVARGH